MSLVGASGSFGGISGSNAVARLLVVISGTSAPLTTALASADKSLSGFGANAGSIGSALTRSVTLPLLAIGGASVAMAVQFQSALGRIAGLTPILDQTGKSIQDIGQELLDLAQTVPTGPVELANSLYFAGSAGLSAATAMDVVKLSAQGAAIGMGSAADISKVLIFAMNNYGSAAFDAGTAMDALTVAIREGTAEPEEMAVALGRLLPVAKEAGVTFQEVVGSVAALTNVGFPARVATTSLRALFSELLSPTIAATNALSELGLTAVDVSNTLRTGGPIAAFQLLEEATHGDAAALHDIIPQIRGFSAFLALTNDQMAAAKRIYDATQNSAGALAKAFDIISQTPGFKFEVGLNKLKVAAISLGDALIPVFVKIAEVIGEVADTITGLPNFANTGLAGLIVAGAAIGPLLKLVGVLTETRKVTDGVNAGFSRMAVTGKAAAAGFITMGIAAIIAVGSFQSMASGSTSLFSILGTSVGTIVAVTLAIKGLAAAALSGKLGAGLLSEAFVAMGPYALAIAATVATIVTVVGLFIGKANSAKNAANQLGSTLFDAATSGETFKKAIEGIQDAGLRKIISDIATANHLLNTTVGQGFGQLISGQADQVTSSFLELSHVFGTLTDNPVIDPEDIVLLQKAAGAAQLAADKGITYGEALKEVGVNGEVLNDVLHHMDLQGLVPSGTTESLVEMNNALYASARANSDWQAEQLASVVATGQNQQAIAAYADQLGVSTDYLSGRLQTFGVDAATAGDEVKQGFETMAFTSSETGKTISASMAEAQAAVEKTVTSINESLGSGFTLFDKLDDKVKKSTGQLLHLAEAQSQSLLQEAANLKILAQRGVPADLIAKIAEQGPGVVQKFVDASKSQLRRLETAYSTGLGAIDDQILAEAAHQKTKGQDMVAGFATSILSSSNLPTDAARKIVADVTKAVSSGNLRPSALALITTFVNGLGRVQGLSQQEGAKAAQYFANGLIKGNLVTKSGAVLVGKLSEGLHRSVGLTRRQAQNVAQTFAREVRNSASEVLPSGKHIVDQLTTGMESKTGEVKSTSKGLAHTGVLNINTQAPQYQTAGELLGQAFAAGLGGNTSVNAAVDSANKIAAAAKAALDKGLRNSPEYFTYYMGKKLAKDMQRGLDDNSRIRGFKPVVDTRGISHVDRPSLIGRGGHGGRRDRTTLDVHIGRERFNREISYSVRGSGR